MKDIQIQVINPHAVAEAEHMLVAMARLTQKGHAIRNSADFTKLLSKAYTEDTVRALCALPHPTIQKFGVINIAVIGASRRFLAQITRHQNEVKFMSASLQYSDYTGAARFVVPYELLAKDIEKQDFAEYEDNYHVNRYMDTVNQAFANYERSIEVGVDRDSAGYQMPQGMRNVLVISATPYQFKHIINQRICRRNTSETRYVMLRIWEALSELGVMFDDCGCSCMKLGCDEGKMSCGLPYRKQDSAVDILARDYKYIYKRGE